MKIRLVLLTVFTLARSASAEDSADFRIERDVAYLGDDRSEKADLYLPRSIPAGQRVPAVVIIHGGGFTGGNRDAARELNIGGTLASHGIIGMSIDYVLAAPGKPVWPRNLYDCKNAVRWLRVNADRLQIDGAHLGVIGGSAGGTLASLVTLTRASDDLEPAGPNEEISSAVQCGVDLYGIADMGQWHDNVMFGKTNAEAPELYRRASPVTYARADDPPLLILHGTADKTVDVAQSEMLDAALQKAGAPHQLVIIPDAPHTFTLQPKQRDLRPLVLEFFDRYLRPAK